MVGRPSGSDIVETTPRGLFSTRYTCALVGGIRSPSTRITDTVGRRPAMIIGSLLAGVAVVAIPFAPNIVVLVIILCAYGVAAAFLGTAPAAAVGDAAGGRAGRGVAVFSMCADFGAIVGPLVAGLLADHVSYPVAFGAGAVLIFVAAVFAFRMPAMPRPD